LRERGKIPRRVWGGAPAANAFLNIRHQIWPVSATYLSDYSLSDYLFFYKRIFSKEPMGGLTPKPSAWLRHCNQVSAPMAVKVGVV